MGDPKKELEDKYRPEIEKIGKDVQKELERIMKDNAKAAEIIMKAINNVKM